MMMDINNPVIRLCVEGTQAEFQGDSDLARELYRKAWDAAGNDFETCVAAHYLAHLEDDPQRRLELNQLALEKAGLADQNAVRDFYPSLFLNLGQSYELLGRAEEAKRFYQKAADLGVIHQSELWEEGKE